MAIKEIDQVALEHASHNGMSIDLHVPIAARTITAIEKYIGSISPISSQAYIVNPYHIPERNPRLPIWRVKEANILHHEKQMWVHVDYTGYRNAYMKAFPDEDISNLVLDHIMNRRVARLKEFEYLRIVPISKLANTCSGNVTEGYSVTGLKQHFEKGLLRKQDGSFIHYADCADIIKMMNICTGGKFQNGLRDVLHFFFED